MLNVHIKSKSYENDLVIENLELVLGLKKYQITGKNGSGKTTLINIISKIDSKYDGEVVINGITYEVKDYICVSSQTSMLITEFSLNDYLRILDTNYDVSNLISIFKIDADKKIANLSGGQQQKVQIILTLISSCPIIIFDEPFNNLDKSSTIYLEEELSKITNKLVILIDHHKLHNSFVEIDISKIKSFNEVEKKEINSSTIVKPSIRTLKLLKINLILFITILMGLSFIFIICIANTNLEQPLAYTDSEYYYSEGNLVEGGIEVVPIFYDPTVIKINDTSKYEIEMDNIATTYLTSENYDALKEELLIGNYVSKITIYQFQQPKEVIEIFNGYIPLYGYEYLIDGTLPQNNTKELMVNQYVAGYMENQGVEDIIGSEIQGYTVTGIYSGTSVSGAIILGYDENSEYTVQNLENCQNNNTCGYITTTYYENVNNVSNQPPGVIENITNNIERFLLLVIFNVIMFTLMMFIVILAKYNVKTNMSKLKIYNQEKYPKLVSNLMLAVTITSSIVVFILILVKFM